jgi:hypothetical protein
MGMPPPRPHAQCSAHSLPSGHSVPCSKRSSKEAPQHPSANESVMHTHVFSTIHVDPHVVLFVRLNLALLPLLQKKLSHMHVYLHECLSVRAYILCIACARSSIHVYVHNWPHTFIAYLAGHHVKVRKSISSPTVGLVCAHAYPHTHIRPYLEHLTLIRGGENEIRHSKVLPRTCMDTYIHKHIHIHTHTHIHTYIHTYTHTYAHTYIHAYIHA